MVLRIHATDPSLLERARERARELGVNTSDIVRDQPPPALTFAEGVVFATLALGVAKPTLEIVLILLKEWAARNQPTSTPAKQAASTDVLVLEARGLSVQASADSNPAVLRAVVRAMVSDESAAE